MNDDAEDNPRHGSAESDPRGGLNQASMRPAGEAAPVTAPQRGGKPAPLSGTGMARYRRSQAGGLFRSSSPRLAVRGGQRLRRRRRVARSGLAVGVMLAISAGTGIAVSRAALGKTTPASRSMTITPRAEQAIEVAAVHQGSLSVVDEATGRSVVVALGPYYGKRGSAIGDPGFSHDGRFVAYIETIGNASSLHVTPSRGGRATTVNRAVSYAWSPVDDDLAVSLRNQVDLISRAGRVLRQWYMTDPGPERFSRSGKDIEVSSRALPAANGYLRVLPVRVAPQRPILYQPGFCEIPAAWTAGGSRLLFWRDPGCSASLAADGLPLYSIAAGGGPVVRLGTTLPYPGRVLPVSGVTVLVNAGADRVAADHKVCAPAMPRPARADRSRCRLGRAASIRLLPRAQACSSRCVCGNRVP